MPKRKGDQDMGDWPGSIHIHFGKSLGEKPQFWYGGFHTPISAANRLLKLLKDTIARVGHESPPMKYCTVSLKDMNRKGKPVQVQTSTSKGNPHAHLRFSVSFLTFGFWMPKEDMQLLHDTLASELAKV
jgi:hypothetical protein